MQALTPQQKEAITALRNRVRAIEGIEDIREDVLQSMITDWIDNAEPNEPGINTEIELIDLLKENYPDVEVGNQQASELLEAWKDFVAEFYAEALNAPNNVEMMGGKRKKLSKKTRKHKKHPKKTRKHKKQSKKTRKH